MTSATKEALIKNLTEILDLLHKCGGPGGTPGPCPSGSGHGTEGLKRARGALTKISSNIASVTVSGNYEHLQQSRRDLTKVSSDLAGQKHPAAKHAGTLVDDARHFIFKVEPNHDIKAAARHVEGIVDEARHHLFKVE